MADGEEAIINKTCLKECKYFKGVGCINSSFKFWGCTKLGGMCSEHSDCYFKQLKRKEQECKELKEWQEANQPTGICETCTAKSVDDMYKYKQALNEIEINILKYQGFTFGKPRTMRENDCIYKILDIINKAKEKK